MFNSNKLLNILHKRVKDNQLFQYQFRSDHNPAELTVRVTARIQGLKGYVDYRQDYDDFSLENMIVSLGEDVAMDIIAGTFIDYVSSKFQEDFVKKTFGVEI